jgi:aquaporin NIP
MDRSPALWRRSVAEGVAAFALVFAGCRAVVADGRDAHALGTVGVALAFGLAIMVMVHATGHLSGAHINPAVTIAFTLTRHFAPREAVAYVGAQLLGAIAVPGALAAVWTDHPAHLGTLPTIATGSALVYEALLPAILMFVIMAVAIDTRTVGAAAACGALAYQAVRWT